MYSSLLKQSLLASVIVGVASAANAATGVSIEFKFPDNGLATVNQARGADINLTYNTTSLVFVPAGPATGGGELVDVYYMNGSTRVFVEQITITTSGYTTTSPAGVSVGAKLIGTVGDVSSGGQCCVTCANNGGGWTMACGCKVIHTCNTCCVPVCC